jgi:UDP-glucuronate 4-epimerase
MPQILVTGGAGFIGSHLVQRLVADGASVTVLDDFNDFYDPSVKRANLAAAGDSVRLVEGDLCDPAVIAKAFDGPAFDIVIHLAARAGVRPSREQPALYLRTNIDGTFHLLEAVRNAGVPKFIFASSSSVYGLNKKLPFSESDRIDQTISPYAATKLAGEQLCSTYANLYDIRTVCLRFFTVYGPRQRPDLAISKFTRLINEGKPIPKFGDGSSARDYTYVEDIVAGIIAACGYEGPIFDVFNLGGSQTTTLAELIELVENALGKTAEIEQFPDQPGDLPRTYADVSKAGEFLGYAPATPIAAGVPKYVDWYLEHIGAATAPV